MSSDNPADGGECRLELGHDIFREGRGWVERLGPGTKGPGNDPTHL